MKKGKKSEYKSRTVYKKDLQKVVVKAVQNLIIDGNQEYMAISYEVMNLRGENLATELEDINQEIADLQKDILARVKPHCDVTKLVERVQELRSRKTEIKAGRIAEKRNKGRINNLRESIEKSRDKCSLMMKNWSETLSRSRSFPINLPFR